MHVSVQPALRWERRVVQAPAIIVALAGLHEHDGPLEALAGGTAEQHWDRPGAAGGAAASVQTHPAVVRTVESRAAAAGVTQTERFRRLLCAGTLPPLLYRHSRRAAGTNVAESGFLHKFALRVLIGDPRRNAHPTAPRTGRPARGLRYTLTSGLLPCWQVFSAAWFVPAFLHLHELITQAVFGLGWRFLEGVWVGEQKRWWLRASEHRRQDGRLSMAVQAEAALARDFDQPGFGTGRGGQRDISGTQGDAAHCPVYTGALVFAARTEVFPILIHAAVILTRAALQFGPADAVQTGHIIPIVTLQALVMIAGLSFMAVVVELRRTHFTASAGVRYCAHTRRAHGPLCWTAAHLRATPSTRRAEDPN